MAKMKGLFKGIKNISNMFVYKDHEMEIGHPTDVRHVAHIGWDGGSVNSPSWMAQFQTTSEFSATATVSDFGQSRDVSWASEEEPCSNSPKVSKKVKRRKPKVSSPSSTRSSSRSSKGRPRCANGAERTTEGLQDEIQVNS